MIKADKITNSFFGFCVCGKNVFDLIDPSDRLKLKARAIYNLENKTSTKKYNLYLVNKKYTEPFYLAAKSMAIHWDGKPALMGIVKKISLPVQTAINFTAGE